MQSEHRHPVWSFLEVISGERTKEKVSRCRCCGLEKKGASAQRWAIHLVGRKLGRASEMGITPCTGKIDEALWKKGIEAINLYQTTLERKQDESRQEKAQREGQAGVGGPAGGIVVPGGDPNAPPGLVGVGIDGQPVHMGDVKRHAMDSHGGSSKRQKSCDVAHVDSTVSKFFLTHGIPFTLASSPEFLEMMHTIIGVDPHAGYTPPTEDRLRMSARDDQVGACHGLLSPCRVFEQTISGREFLNFVNACVFVELYVKSRHDPHPMDFALYHLAFLITRMHSLVCFVFAIHPVPWPPSPCVSVNIRFTKQDKL
jgi:hypothetical protein